MIPSDTTSSATASSGPTSTDPAPCPCGSAAPYVDHCGRIHAAFAHDGTLAAPTAEALMRSRYSAYALLGEATAPAPQESRAPHRGTPHRDAPHRGALHHHAPHPDLAHRMVAYLRATWAAEQRPAVVELLPAPGERAPRFTRLAVLVAHAAGPDEATVEFVALGRDDADGRVRLHERSRFRREAGAWLYVDGVAP